jgi:DNA-binding IclR family transcriptional regulator
MQDDPNRPWPGRELADKLGIKPRNMLTQLAEWTRLGFLTRAGTGTYTLPTRRDTESP